MQLFLYIVQREDTDGNPTTKMVITPLVALSKAQIGRFSELHSNRFILSQDDQIEYNNLYNLMSKEHHDILVDLLPKAGDAYLVNGVSYTRVGRWMSPKELEIMKETGRLVEGAGFQTFVSINGVEDFEKQAQRGSVYVEFSVPSTSLLSGGVEGWKKTIGKEASGSQQFMLKKQGGEHTPKYIDLSPTIKLKE